MRCFAFSVNPYFLLPDPFGPAPPHLAHCAFCGEANYSKHLLPLARYFSQWTQENPMPGAWQTQREWSICHRRSSMSRCDGV